MQVTAAAPMREHEKPMSWPRAIVIATGFFFVTSIFLGMIPSYVYTVATLSTLQRLEQGFLSLGLLSLGLGALCLEIALLYDPRPIIPWPLFALLGLAVAVVGGAITFMVSFGGWPLSFPTADQGYLISPIWFQPGSIDVASIGMIGLIIGIGMFAIAALNPWVLSGRAFGPLRDLAVQACIGLAVVLVALYLSVATFAPAAFAPVLTEVDASGNVTHRLGTPYPFGNVMLFLALALALVGLLVWLLPIMVANRQQFMPPTYLHGVVGLIGTVAIPLLLVWAVVYPLMYWVHSWDTAQFWVQCSQKNKIPASCSFTPFTGYLICAIVFNMLFGILILGIYFWSTRRNTVVIGGTIALIWLGLAVMAIHTVFQPELPLQVPTSLLIATCVLVLGFIFTWATQREFAPTRAQQLGCTGQWLVLGTLLLIFLFGFALLSVLQVFELESGLALFWQPGAANLHDAYWGILLMGGLALLQLAIFIRRKPMTDLRKFAMWSILIGIALMIVASIQGFPSDLGYAFNQNGIAGVIDAIGAAHLIFGLGMLFEIVGVAATVWGALRNARSLRWLLIIGVVAALGVAFAFIAYSLPIAFPDLVAMGIIGASAGALAYTALGPDTPEEAAGQPAANGAYGTAGPNGGNGAASGNGGAPFAVTRR
jgi:hypothetical protein